MATSDLTFQNQHVTLMGLGAAIVQAMPDAAGDEGLRRLRLAVARFKGALLVHQRMENEALYPQLMEHPDATIREPARALYAELGTIYDAFVDFEQRFGASEAIAANVPEYVGALKRLLKKLFARMQREDQELYTLAQRASVPTRSSAPGPLLDDDASAASERARWLRSLPPR